jgi:hypothetical protein
MKHHSSEYKENHLHSIFHSVLKTFIDAQNSRLLDNTTITLGGHQQHVVNLCIPCIFMIGDMQRGDKMYCSLAGYFNKMAAHLCCKCNVQGENSGHPFVQCKQMSMIKMCALVNSNNVSALQAINQYNVHSAWFDVGHGGC